MRLFFPLLAILGLIVPSDGFARESKAQTLFAESTSTWPSVDYSRVRAFAYDYAADTGVDIVIDGRLNTSARPKGGVALSDSQIQQVLYSVRNTFSAHYRTFCFKPRNGFVFYDSQGQIVAYLSICFECGRYTSSPEGTSRTWDLTKLRAIFSQLRVSTTAGR